MSATDMTDLKYIDPIISQHKHSEWYQISKTKEGLSFVSCICLQYSVLC